MAANKAQRETDSIQDSPSSSPRERNFPAIFRQLAKQFRARDSRGTGQVNVDREEARPTIYKFPRRATLWSRRPRSDLIFDCNASSVIA